MREITALPLFPLQAVLFPGGLLPLRIFEVRYLDMISRCHQQGTPFGVVSLTQGTEVQRPRDAATEPTGGAGGTGAAGGGTGNETYAPEAFRDVGTLARIDDLQRPQPGLLSVRCTGTQRFKVSRSERLRHGLWTADVTLFDDDPVVPVPGDLHPVRAALQQLVGRLSQPAAGATPDLPLQTPYHWDDSGWVANRWSELLPLDGATRHRLMVLDNPLLRLELVADAMQQLGFKPPA